jgi:hypothetical protein
MRLIGVAVILALSLLAPLAAEGQQAGKIYRIGILETTSMALNAANSTPSAKGYGNSGTSRGAT